MSVNWLLLRARSWVLLALGRTQAAMQVFDEMAALRPADPFPRASRAFLHAQGGAWSLAEADYLALTRAHADNAGYWFNLGFVREKLGDAPGAAQAHGRAVALNPKLDLAWYGLGLALLQQQRLDEALTAFVRNTELQPMSPYGWTQLARVHARRQDHAQAAQVLARLQEFEPQVASALARELAIDPAR